mgnify:CR=1 FL=1|tara:strand:- start:10127 stop:10258 length:132 start_codon:yes stop_codon:yes gene_type:complete
MAFDFFITLKTKLIEVGKELWEAHPLSVLVGFCIVSFVLGLMI